MVRPRKYGGPMQAVAAKAEQGRQHYLARQAYIIQEQVPRFVSYMPLPANIPSSTPAQLNLRIDVPEVVASAHRDLWVMNCDFMDLDWHYRIESCRHCHCLRQHCYDQMTKWKKMACTNMVIKVTTDTTATNKSGTTCR